MKIGDRVKVIHLEQSDVDDAIILNDEGSIIKHPFSDDATDYHYVDYDSGILKWMHPNQLEIVESLSQPRNGELYYASNDDGA